MNATQPAAHVRAVTGFRDSDAGTGSIVSFAWNRSLLWLLVRCLPLVILICWNIAPARADGVNAVINSGKTVTGRIASASGFDTYTFKVPVAGASFILDLAEAGSHDESFIPSLNLTDPAGHMSGKGRVGSQVISIPMAAEGKWTVKVDRHKFGSTGGAYVLTLIEIPGAIAGSGGTPAIALTPGTSYPQSSTPGQLSAFTFQGVAGQKMTLSLDPAVGSGVFPQAAIFAPGGGPAGGVACNKGCSQDFTTATGGTYTIVAWRTDNNEVTGTYSLSVVGSN
jgi:hypothetical protein